MIESLHIIIILRHIIIVLKGTYPQPPINCTVLLLSWYVTEIRSLIEELRTKIVLTKQKTKNADLVCKFMRDNTGIGQTFAIDLIPPGVFPLIRYLI